MILVTLKSRKVEYLMIGQEVMVINMKESRLRLSIRKKFFTITV